MDCGWVREKTAVSFAEPPGIFRCAVLRNTVYRFKWGSIQLATGFGGQLLVKEDTFFGNALEKEPNVTDEDLKGAAYFG